MKNTNVLTDYTKLPNKVDLSGNSYAMFSEGYVTVTQNS